MPGEYVSIRDAKGTMHTFSVGTIPHAKGTVSDGAETVPWRRISMRLAVKQAKCSPIAQYDMTRARDLDGCGIFKLCKVAGNRFDRNAEIIGDVLSRHWKFDIVAARAALSHFQ